MCSSRRYHGLSGVQVGLVNTIIQSLQCAVLGGLVTALTFFWTTVDVYCALLPYKIKEQGNSLIVPDTNDNKIVKFTNELNVEETRAVLFDALGYQTLLFLVQKCTGAEDEYNIYFRAD
jgi:hypothetical protein